MQDQEKKLQQYKDDDTHKRNYKTDKRNLEKQEEEKTSTVRPIHKKRKPVNCDKNKGIAFLDVTCLLSKYDQKWRKQFLGEYQEGFRKAK